MDEDESKEDNSSNDANDVIEARLKSWVKHYVACMSVETITVNTAMKHCEEKFNKDLSEFKKVFKQMLLNAM
jgi:hypothetical protein